MNTAAPNPWKGYRLAGAGDKSVRVESIPEWFRKYFKLDASSVGRGGLAAV